MNKKKLKWIFVIIFLLTFSTPVQADIVATIGMAGLSFASPELASAVSIALCVMGPTGIITCAAQFVEGKIVGQVVGEAYQAIEEISPEAAQVISTYNQVKGYMDLGTEIKVDLSVDETGSIIEGSIDVGDEEISIGNQISKNLNEGDIKVSNANIHFFEYCEDIYKNICNNEKLTEIRFINGDFCNDGLEYTPCDEDYIPSKNGIFSQTVYDRDTGEPIEINTEILYGGIEFDYETGRIVDANFNTGDKETSFLIGTHEVILPPYHNVRISTGHNKYRQEFYEDGNNKPIYIIRPSSIIPGREEYFSKSDDRYFTDRDIPVIYDIMLPQPLNIDGEHEKIQYDYYSTDAARLKSGVVFGGSLSYKNGELFLDKGNKFYLFNDNLDNFKIFNVEEGGDLSDYDPDNSYDNFKGVIWLENGIKEIFPIDSNNLCSYDEEGKIKNFNLKIKNNNKLEVSFNKVYLKNIKQSSININFRQNKDLIPLVEIIPNGQNDRFTISNGNTYLKKERGNLMQIPFQTLIHDEEFDYFKTPSRMVLFAKDENGESILGSKENQKKIIFNRFGQFKTIPLELDNNLIESSIGNEEISVLNSFSEILSFTPTLDTIEKEFERKYGFNVEGFNKESQYVSLISSLEIMTPEMRDSVRKLRVVESIGEGNVAGTANPTNNLIRIYADTWNVDTIIHEVGHTFTFDLFKKNDKLFENEFKILKIQLKDGFISNDNFKIERKKLKDKYSITNKWFSVKDESEFMKRWDEISQDPYGKDLNVPTVGTVKVGNFVLVSGNSNLWADSTIEPRHGCLGEYGCNNHWEDTAVFIEEAYGVLIKSGYSSWEKDIIKEDSRYLAKLELLKEYNAISEGLYNKILDIVYEYE